MKFTCGIDILEIDRIEEYIKEGGKTFLKNIFTDKEIAYCELKKRKYQHYAARFAAKEAVIKAISNLVNDKNIEYNRIEITNNEYGKPLVNVLINIKQKVIIDLSISHSEKYAIANAIVYVI